MSNNPPSIVLPKKSNLNGIKKGALYFLNNNILKAVSPFYEDTIAKAATPTDVISVFVRPDRLGVLDVLYTQMSKDDLSQALANAWTDVESPNMDANMTKEQAVRLFKICNPQKLMSKDELSVFTGLPDIIKVYRGLGKRNSKNIEALSWTLGIKRAEWFAKRFDFGNGEYEVYQAEIDRKYIFAYFNRRNEQEVVLDYHELRNIILLPK